MISKDWDDLAAAIYDEITADAPDGCTDAALMMWNNYPKDPPRDRMARVLAFVAAVSISKVLDRRERETSRIA